MEITITKEELRNQFLNAMEIFNYYHLQVKPREEELKELQQSKNQLLSEKEDSYRRFLLQKMAKIAIKAFNRYFEWVYEDLYDAQKRIAGQIWKEYNKSFFLTRRIKVGKMLRMMSKEWGIEPIKFATDSADMLNGLLKQWDELYRNPLIKEENIVFGENNQIEQLQKEIVLKKKEISKKFFALTGFETDEMEMIETTCLLKIGMYLIYLENQKSEKVSEEFRNLMQ